MALQMLPLGSAPSQVMPLAQQHPPSVRWATFLPSQHRSHGPWVSLGATSVGNTVQQGRGTQGRVRQHLRARRGGRGKQRVTEMGWCVRSALGRMQSWRQSDVHLFPPPQRCFVPPHHRDGVRESTRVPGQTQHLAALPARGPEEGFGAISPANLSAVISLIVPLRTQKKR